ncbi:pyridine nucleotide-disulfide oxidoreductase [Klebsiella pneumoniae]|uniref:Pyridine nucleotide-disulfide oxidoreductase n=1 Tax=Klebsiella pneumoniae TaxID=573 RepID=A0A2X3EX61_KLEPN|nr:pyridine nucleotide-disulfide oxidoreductase [Klebsiella pneumoniae]
MNTLRCDILILGAGPAGMAAALSAAACDKQVIILDDNPPLADKSGVRVRRRRYRPWPGATATPSPRQPPSG